jgi:vacuolar-type H+-ATPase subunit H
MSTDQPEMEKQLASVADLLSKRKNREVLTAQEQRVMAYFEDEVNDALPVGTSEAQRVVQEAVAEFLQRRKKEPSSEWETIRVETKTKILNILKDF